MELPRLEEPVPAARGLPKRPIDAASESQQRKGIEQAEHGAHDQLAVPRAHDGQDRLAEGGEQHGADERARHGAGEREVVVAGAQARADVPRRRAVPQDVVRRLQVERLLDLAVRRGDEVQQDERGEQRVEGEIWGGKKAPFESAMGFFSA